ncbi:MAG TPA: response regulator transcription factor [Selenomonadales bacterium]|nr:response regulator transcription factor [Selenomonadales bacterium]
MAIKILVADDEPSICEVVKLYLEREGFTVFSTGDGEAAMELEATHQPDLLILDVMLPKHTGWEICRALPRRVPVIFLTAKGTEADKITGFSLGADDYVTKPFSPKELVARVKAVLRRSGLIFEAGDVLRFPGLVINPATQTVEHNNEEITLTPKEFDLLLFLARHPKAVFSREQLLTNVWGYQFDGDDRTVDATVKRLRQKFTGEADAFIHTVWGVGYKFEVNSR